MTRLFLAVNPPRVGGLDGIIRVSTIGLERVSELLRDRNRTIVSLISFQSTCDVLAVVGSKTGIHRYNKDRDAGVDQLMRDGDAWLSVLVKPASRSRASDSLGVFDFDFTLCEFSTETDQTRGRPCRSAP